MGLMELFFAFNALLVGVLATLAVQHWFAHRRDIRAPKATQNNSAPVSAAVRERITKQAEQNFQGIVNRSSLQLQRDLSTTGTQLNKLLEKFGSEVLDEEMKLFRNDVSSIRAATQVSLSGAQDEITKQQTALLSSLASRQKELDDMLDVRRKELEAALDTSFTDEKARLTQNLNDKMNDAVIAFLVETLGHDADLGAQTDHLLATLEANKADLVKEITS